MSNTKSPNTKATVLANVQAIIEGTTKHFPNASFTIGTTAYTSASVIQALAGLENAMKARNAAESSAKDAISAEHATAAQVSPILRVYKRLVLATFANATQTLADFGFAPPKARTPLTTEQRAVSAAKARATRVARGTTGKKQKKAIKGDVTGVIVTPVTSTAAVRPVISAATLASPASPVSTAPSATPTVK
jgi:hypothetical protein